MFFFFVVTIFFFYRKKKSLILSIDLELTHHFQFPTCFSVFILVPEFFNTCFFLCVCVLALIRLCFFFFWVDDCTWLLNPILSHNVSIQTLPSGCQIVPIDFWCDYPLLFVCLFPLLTVLVPQSCATLSLFLILLLTV